jgi:DegV family protein with EDD domain
VSKIAILTDSTAYIPPELIEAHQIHVIPLKVIWGSDIYLDGIDIEPEVFFSRLASDPAMPTTTQPNPEEFTQVYEKLAADFDAIFVVLISSALSGTVFSAQSAAAEFSKVPVHVFDSQLTAMGLGHVVLAAARAADEGKSLEEIAQIAETYAANTSVRFAVDTLEFLHRGGRIGGAARLVGTALSLKPILQLKDGKIDALEKVRTRSKVIDRLLQLAVEQANGQPVRAAIFHSSQAEEIEALKVRLSEQVDCVEFIITGLSPVIATHTGPGTVGMAICTVTP